MKKIRVYDIEWFYNYEDHCDYMSQEDYDKTFNEEPTEIIVDVTDFDWNDQDELEEMLSNYISDCSGYYHEGFSWENLVESEN
jgi:hypothetical protein